MTIDRTPAGEQRVLPGAEKASNATLAQRLADAPLRPKREQSPTANLGGLFGDASKQVEMF
jgi:hypothetical protein